MGCCRALERGDAGLALLILVPLQALVGILLVARQHEGGYDHPRASIAHHVSLLNLVAKRVG